MLAVDTSSLVAFFAGASGGDATLIEKALTSRALMIPPVVLTELLSAPNLTKELRALIIQMPLIPLADGAWQRCGDLRQKLLRKRKKARIADSLIAQSCIDSNVPLLTRDGDFKKYQEYGLKLVRY